MTPSALLKTVRRELHQAADTRKAREMQAYMKSAMPYHGVQTPRRREILRRVFAGVEFADARDWRAHVLHFWRAAKFREERYASLELAGHRKAREFQTLEALPMYEELIV